MITAILASLALATAPTAIVDSARGTDAVTEFMLLRPGMTIDLGTDGRVRIAYFASCVHETLRGGRLRIGVTASISVNGIVERVTADCDPPLYGRNALGRAGALVLRNAATADRLNPAYRLRNTQPMLVGPPGTTFVLTRLRPTGRRLFIPVGPGTVALADLGVTLERDAVYRACVDQRCARVWIDPAARNETGPILERLLHLY
jgi:hypothetical protein